jgi:hypothetical protein
MAAFRNDLRRTESKANKLVEDTLIRLAEISNSVSNSKGTLEVRVVDYLPPWTLIAINPSDPDGFMSIRLTTFRISNDRRPSFDLRRKVDNKWFLFFLEQFEAVWKEAKKVDLNNYLQV